VSRLGLQELSPQVVALVLVGGALSRLSTSSEWHG
jgi:hypothetical protein